MSANLAQTATLETALPPSVLRSLRAALDRDLMLEELDRGRVHEMLDVTAIEGCRVERVHFGSGLGVVIDYSIDTRTEGARERIKVFGQVPYGDPADAFDAAQAKIVLRSGVQREADRPRLCLLSGIGVVLRQQGADERIDMLPALMARTPGHLKIALATLGDHAPRWSDVRLLSHRLGKRAVLRLSSGARGGENAGAAILKLYKRRSHAAAHCAMISAAAERQGLVPEGTVAIPRIIRLLEGVPGLLMEEAPGLPLNGLTGAARIAGHRSAGQALARLHASRVPGLAPYRTEDEIGLLTRWLGFASNVRPDLVALVAPRVERLERDAERCRPFVPVPIHRDFHDKQIIVAHDRATLIDFDTVCAGDAAQDLGNFLAHAYLEERAGPTPPTQSHEVLAFTEGYRSITDLPSDINIDWHRRASLLRLAMIASFSDSSRHLADALVDAA